MLSAAQVTWSMWESRNLPMKIAIVGAGMAGLTCAQALNLAGLRISVFDKGRGPGGRMSTRRMEPWHFDHGAQYLTAREPEFQAQVRAWEALTIVQPWTGRIVRFRHGVLQPLQGGELRYVGVPGMSAIVRYLTRELDVHYDTQVSTVTPHAHGWRLQNIAGADLGVFQVVVLALPAPQTVELIIGLSPIAARAVVKMAPCWSIMLGFNRTLEFPFDGAFMDDPALAWAARNNSKPGRPPAEAWTLHATREWSAEHLELGGEQVAARLLASFASAVNEKRLFPMTRIYHRWRFAQAVESVGEAYLYDPERRLGACGDWCLEGRIEAAWRSGRALALRILEDTVSPSGHHDRDQREAGLYGRALEESGWNV